MKIKEKFGLDLGSGTIPPGAKKPGMLHEQLHQEIGKIINDRTDESSTMTIQSNRGDFHLSFESNTKLHGCSI